MDAKQMAFAERSGKTFMEALGKVLAEAKEEQMQEVLLNVLMAHHAAMITVLANSGELKNEAGQTVPKREVYVEFLQTIASYLFGPGNTAIVDHIIPKTKGDKHVN